MLTYRLLFYRYFLRSFVVPKTVRFFWTTQYCSFHFILLATKHTRIAKKISEQKWLIRQNNYSCPKIKQHKEGSHNESIKNNSTDWQKPFRLSWHSTAGRLHRHQLHISVLLEMAMTGAEWDGPKCYQSDYIYRSACSADIASWYPC